MFSAVSGWWGLCALMMVVCMVMMIPMMGRGHGHSGHGWRSWQGRVEDPERTLADRLARGEIDRDEYHRLLETMRGTDHSAHA